VIVIRSRVAAQRVIALAVMLAAATAGAGQTERAEMHFHDGSYEYTFTALLEGSSAAVHAIVTDYDNLGRINDDIVESRVLERYPGGGVKRVLRLTPCLLLFCFNLHFVESVRETPGRIVTTVIPAESNFADGRSEWRIEAIDAGRTRISVNARQTPTFWIPPVIGPLLLRHVFLREVRETCTNIERLASAARSTDA
jgi:hypothetical protein